MAWTQILLNLSNCLYLVSYGVRDVLILRSLSITAMLVALPYYFYHMSEPAWVPIRWNVAFMLINLGWVIKIFLERRPPKFTPEQRKLYEYTFHHSCSPREMLQLLSKATWEEVDSGTQLVDRGRVSEDLVVIHDGVATVKLEGRELGRLRDGDLVGEMSFLTQEPAVADVFAAGPLKFVRWSKQELEQLYEQKLELKVAVQGVIGQNLVGRIANTFHAVPEVSLSMQR